MTKAETTDMDRLAPGRLQELTDTHDVGRLDYPALVRAFRDDPSGIGTYRPEGVCRVDPRTGTRVVYSLARAKRPHDNRPGAQAPIPFDRSRPEDCIVCQGRTTRVVDRARLSDGETFINKNLFPILWPDEAAPAADSATGLHFLQWTHDRHDRDLDNMPAQDIAVVLGRLAALEAALMHGASGLPEDGGCGSGPHRGSVGIIKNVGRLVGGSLVHGHQQAIHSSVVPRALDDDRRFAVARGVPFGQWLVAANPPGLTIADYGPVRLLVPYFMARPLAAMVVPTGPVPPTLHEQTSDVVLAFARALGDLCRGLTALMPAMGREVAYNLTFHNGTGGAIYCESHPYTQETGGYEHLGLFLCQGTPEGTAEAYRQALAGR